MKILITTIANSLTEATQLRVLEGSSQGGAGPKGTTILLETAHSAIRPRAKVDRYSWT